MHIQVIEKHWRRSFIGALLLAETISFSNSTLLCLAEDFTSSLPSPTYEVSTESAKSLFKHGNQLYKEGDLEQADKLFKEVIDRDPSNVTAHFNRGVIAEQQNDLTSALGHYQNALQYKPNDHEIQTAIAEVSAKLPAKTVGEIVPFTESGSTSGKSAGHKNSQSKKPNHKQSSQHDSQLTKRLARRGLTVALRLSLRHW